MSKYPLSLSEELAAFRNEPVEMVCPLCKNDNFHPMAPSLSGKYEEGGADYCVIIPFWCEQGCKGYIEIHHHEGYATVKAYNDKK